MATFGCLGLPRGRLTPDLSRPVLIRLEKKGERCAVRSQFVQPICLPEPGSPFPAGHKCQIAGWGHQDESECGQGARVVPPGAVARPSLSTPPTPCWPADVSGYSPSLREALVPLVADHKCSSPEVYGADISPNMLCAGYFDCRSDACQVSLGSPPPRSSEPRAARPSGQPGGGAGGPPPSRWLPPGWVLTRAGSQSLGTSNQGQECPYDTKGQSPSHPAFFRVGSIGLPIPVARLPRPGWGAAPQG